MTLHLTKAELQALEQKISIALNTEHKDIIDHLVIAILHKLYKRIIVKLLDLKKKYKLELDNETALAFFIYFNSEALILTEFNDITVKIICNTIDKQYA